VRILGIDPGLHVTGYGVIAFRPEKVHLVEAGVLRTQGSDLPKRLQSLWASLEELLVATRPNVLAVEELYSHYAHPARLCSWPMLAVSFWPVPLALAFQWLLTRLRASKKPLQAAVVQAKTRSSG
jgi:hypothetical protein